MQSRLEVHAHKHAHKLDPKHVRFELSARSKKSEAKIKN